MQFYTKKRIEEIFVIKSEGVMREERRSDSKIWYAKVHRVAVNRGMQSCYTTAAEKTNIQWAEKWKGWMRYICCKCICKCFN